MTHSIRRLSEWDASRLRQLADEHGTPLYVYDTDRVRENADRLRDAFPQADVSYAVKANTTRRVLEAIRDGELGAECASSGEVWRALDAGFDDERVRYTAVNPPGEDLDRIASLSDEHDIVLTVDSRDTLERVKDRDYEGRLCVRVNPGVGAGHHAKVRTGDAPQFGVPAERAAELCESARNGGFDLVGIHAHAGSGISGEDLSAHRELVRRMGELGETVGDLSFVAVGGGFGVPYHPDAEPLDLDHVGATTREAYEGSGCDAELAIEPGRYLVADAGVLLTRVNTVKPTAETTVVGVDAGMTTLLRPAMYEAYHEIRSLADESGDRDEQSCLVAGPICETSDVLARDRKLPEPKRGELLAVGNAGAYGYEMANQYNSRPRPAVLTLSGETIARRETIADLTRLESKP